MRTIKFRGKTINGEWVYGDLVQRPPIALIFPLDAPDSQDNYIVDLKTVGQFTGLTDKNGVEIYEGDIVKVDIFTKNYCIVFGESEKWGASFQYKSDFSIYYLTVSFTRDCLVIGNIFDNPELL